MGVTSSVLRVLRLLPQYGMYEFVRKAPGLPDWTLLLFVRRIALQHADVEYLELAKHGLTPGRITFDGLQGMIYDLSNRGTSQQAVFTVKAQGKLMN